MIGLGRNLAKRYYQSVMSVTLIIAVSLSSAVSVWGGERQWNVLTESTVEDFVPEQATKEKIAKTIAKLPLSFEANQGQTDKRVKFLARLGGSTLFLTSTDAVLALSKNKEWNDAVRMRLIGAHSA